MTNKNTRFQCKACPNKVTLNQLRGSGGICIYCKTPIHHDNWRGRSHNPATHLGIDKIQDAEIGKIAEEIGQDPNHLMRAAILNRLRVWQLDPEQAKRDLMLEKLYRP